MVLLDRLLSRMIEFCTKKCMAVTTILMLFITILVLVLENQFSSGHSLHGLTLASRTEDNITGQCWLHEDFQIRQECMYCTDFEKKSRQSHCLETGFKMKIRCKKSGTIWKSCRRPKDAWTDSRDFWLLEAGSLLLAAVSYSVVHVRQRRLDRLLMDKINRQIAAGV